MQLNITIPEFENIEVIDNVHGTLDIHTYPNKVSYIKETNLDKTTYIKHIDNVAIKINRKRYVNYITKHKQDCVHEHIVYKKVLLDNTPITLRHIVYRNNKRVDIITSIYKFNRVVSKTKHLRIISKYREHMTI